MSVAVQLVSTNPHIRILSMRSIARSGYRPVVRAGEGENAARDKPREEPVEGLTLVESKQAVLRCVGQTPNTKLWRHNLSRRSSDECDVISRWTHHTTLDRHPRNVKDML